MKSPKWKLIKANTKNKFADALAKWTKWDITNATMSLLKEAFPEKKFLFVAWQIIEADKQEELILPE